MKSKKIKIPIYDSILIVLLVEDMGELRKKYSFHPDDMLESYNALYFNHKGTHHLAFEEVDVGLIAHESLHAVGKVLDERGILYEPYNDEPFCYLLGWVVDKVTEILNNLNNNETK